MLNLPQPIAIATDRIHPDTLPGYVHLKVIDLDNQVLFYQQAIACSSTGAKATVPVWVSKVETWCA